jgi:hypothetical protein
MARHQYFTRNDIAKHNSSQDCWVIVFDKVFNLTSLVCKQTSEEVMRILEHAGWVYIRTVSLIVPVASHQTHSSRCRGDVSVWFDPATNDVSWETER